MSNLYLIRLSNVEKADEFIKFMFEEIFPIEAIAQDDRSLRGGRIDGLSLLGGSNSPSGVEGGSDGNQNEFLLIVEGLVSGVGSGRIDQIKAFGAEVEDLGSFWNAFNWTRQDKQT